MFLKRLLPSEGMYCVAMLLQDGTPRHFFYPDIEAAQRQLTVLDKGGNTVYIAQATFAPKKIEDAKQHNNKLPRGLPKEEYKRLAHKLRSQDNAIWLKNFFLDIDCGEKWPLKNQKEAIIELKKFIAETGLPFPAVINSGTGLYAHWILEDAIPSSQWRTTAFILKQVVTTYSPAIGGDSSRTSDSASVLRAPGTTNRKPGRDPRTVVILKDAEDISFLAFVDALNTAAKRKGIHREALLAPKASNDINSEFFARTDIPSDPERVAKKCAQMAAMRDARGDISEPLWYALLGILAYCEGGEEKAQEWSSGHAQYNPSQTAAKMQQWLGTGIGPSTCANLGSINTPGCIGCPHNGKIKSPIVLGRPEPEAIILPEEQCEAPEGFRRGKDGLYAADDDRWFRFYDQDLYPDRLAYDESLGYEVMTIKHYLPFEGEMECTLRSSLVNDHKALMTILSDNHIKVMGVKEKKLMNQYLEGYQSKLQRNRRMSMLLCQMGWKQTRAGKPMFVLGKKIFHVDGHSEEASLARNVPKAAEGYHTKGSLEEWSKATEVFDKPGMEPFAFALLAGGFGAPLMKFTGFDGALVSMIGESGSGKTLMLRMVQSVWGKESDLMMLRVDTGNAFIGRLGVYGNLPLTLDEVSNMEAPALSDMVYQITQGREKVRLNRNAVEKANLNTWNTIALASSNHSLVDKLSGLKHDATAEINRVFEYAVHENENFKDDVTTALYWTIQENYGHAGEKYVEYLVTHIDEIKEKIVKIKSAIDSRAGVTGDERFWGAMASVALMGGIIARDLGLIRFDLARMFVWIANTIRGMRGEKNSLASDSISILGQFIDEHSANRLLVKGDARTKEGCTMIEAPRGALKMRGEVDIAKLFFPRAVIREWLARKFGSYTQIKNELMISKILLDPNRRKNLGAGTFYGGAQQVCWEIDMNCEGLDPQRQDVDAAVKTFEKFPVRYDEEWKI